MKKIWILTLAILLVFSFFGCAGQDGDSVKNDVFTDAFFQDVESIGLYGGESMLSGEDMQPVIRHLKQLTLTHSDIVLTHIDEDGDLLYGGPASMIFLKTDGTRTGFLTQGNVITFIDSESYTVSDDDLYSTLHNLFEQQADS